MNPVWHRPLSLTARLALLFGLLAAGLLMGVGIMLERAVSIHFDEIDDHELSTKLAMIGSLLERTTSEPALQTLTQRLDDILGSHDGLAVRIRETAGNPLYSFRPERLAPTRRVGTPPSEPLTRWELAGRRYIGREAVLSLPLPEPLPVQILIVLDITHHAHFLTEVRYRLWIGIALAALVATLLGWLVARKGLAPLRRVTATTSRLSAERLGERLSERDSPAEMLELVNAFNGMLDRLETDFRRLGDFSADIAHELRTPLSNLLTETQVALSRPRSADDYREVLHSNLEEFERLARMIADMLFLAKADHGLLPRPAETVELDAEAQALVDFYDALAAENGVRLLVTGAARVPGDRLMLRRALSNLISNALRHTPRGGIIEISIARDAGGARLAISNPGETIPPEQLPRLFERFHRSGASRSPQGEGAGLGLAITRSIIQAHGGRIDVESANGMTTFTLQLKTNYPPAGGLL